MSFWDNEQAYTAKGIDYDLVGCLENNPQAFGLDDIAQVLAVHEGENEGDNWRWILRLNDGRFAFLQGGCDYTGWDCQSSADSVIVESIDAAIQTARTFEDNTPEIIAGLAQQLLASKAETWHEATGRDLGLITS